MSAAVLDGNYTLKPPPTVLLLDHFTDANGIALTAHTMDVGPGWVTTTGTWSITSDMAGDSLADGVVVHEVQSNAGQSDTTLTVSVVIPLTALCVCGVVFRLVDSSNYLAFFALTGTALTPQFRLSEFVGGVETHLATVAGTYSPGDTLAIKVVTNGSSVICSVNGVVVITTTSTQFQTATKYGLFDFQSTALGFGDATWDNFEVTNP